MDKVVGVEISLIYDDDSVEHEGYYRNIDDAILALKLIKEDIDLLEIKEKAKDYKDRRKPNEQNLSDI